MKPQIPTPQSIVQPAIDKLVELRPRAERHVYGGRYGDIFEGWKAQARLNRDRLADEAVAARLPLASGDALRDLAHSEYWAEIDETPLAAIGEVSIVRQKTNTDNGITGNFTRGVIPAGTRFRKAANQEASPPIAEMLYETTTTTVVDDVENIQIEDVGAGNFLHAQGVTMRVVALRDGADGNTPFFVGEPAQKFQIVERLFDPLFVSIASFAAGGFDGLEDATIRQLARANYLGQFGPTKGALVAAALGHGGAQHIGFLEDTGTASTVMFLADGSWACSQPFMLAVEQVARDTACGFGCRVRAGFVANQRITVSATVVVATAASLSDTTEITKAVQQRLRLYFDGRPDWHTWRLNTIGAAIAFADKRIVACLDDVEVRAASGPLAEPAAKLSGVFATHYYLADDAVNLTFQAPS